MGAGKDAGEEHYDPEREENIPGRNKTRPELREEHFKDPIVALDKALRCVESSCKRGFGPRIFVEGAFCMAGVGFLQSLWEKPIWEGVWPYLVPMDSVCLRTASTEWNVPGKYRPHGDLFFFLIQKETAIVPNSEAVCPFFHADIRTPFFSAEVLKKCAPIALHIVAGGRAESGLSKESDVGE